MGGDMAMCKENLKNLLALTSLSWELEENQGLFLFSPQNSDIRNVFSEVGLN